MKKNEIGSRLEKVASLLIKNKTETQIAKELQVSRSTVVRDVATLKEQSHSWLDDLAKDGFIWEYKLALDKIKYHGDDLSNLYQKTADTAEKIQIVKALDDNTKLYLQLLAEAPTISAFKKALNTKGVVNVPTS